MPLKLAPPKVLGFVVTDADDVLRALVFSGHGASRSVASYVRKGCIIHTVTEGSSLVGVGPGDVWASRRLADVLGSKR